MLLHFYTTYYLQLSAKTYRVICGKAYFDDAQFTEATKHFCPRLYANLQRTLAVKR